MNHNIYAMNLDQNSANFVPLTPLNFLERAASVYPHYTAVLNFGFGWFWELLYSRLFMLVLAV